MKQAFLITLMICIALISGCSKTKVDSTVSSTPTPEAAADAANVTPRAASIPGLEFVVATELAKGDTLKPGATLVRGSYKPALTGKHITSVQWVDGEAEGINRLMLSLQFDDEGTRIFANLIEYTADKDILFVLDGKVIGRLALYESVSSGAITIGSPKVVAARSAIDAATKPLQ